MKVNHAAGPFSEWLRAMRAALAGSSGMDVACGDCVGCCTSSYFIKVRAHETAAIERIGADNLRPVPGSNNGNMLMGFDAQGHCFMFANGGCSIYQHRPETCRTYDCRVFTAAGMNAGPDKSVINERIASWRFDYPSPRDATSIARSRPRRISSVSIRSGFREATCRRVRARSRCWR